jgi:hypothetical protein
MHNRIKVIPPYIHPGHLNFKYPAFEGLSACGLQTGKSYFPWKILHHWAFLYEMPRICVEKRTAMLMFVEPVSIRFDTFPYYATHEVIPFIWDCWPCYYDKMESWFNRHKTRTAIFTSRMEMEEMQKRYPQAKMLWCPEAVDATLYKKWKPLAERTINLLEFGRSNERVLGKISIDNHVCTYVDGKFIYSNEELYEAMGDAKMTICLPKSMTHPDVAQGVETLTQRYWEAMLSRMLIVGHAPKELIDVCGYNPVLELPDKKEEINTFILDILSHIEDYQNYVDFNRQTALEKGLWSIRMKGVVKWLGEIGYSL